MICRMLHRASLAAVLIAAASAAHAQELRLDCTMTDYSSGGVWDSWSGPRADSRIDVKKLIPERSVHVVEGESAWIEGTELYGTYNRDGRQRQLRYETRIPKVGTAKITYTYIISSGLITGRVLIGSRRIDRITGTCKRQG